MATQLQEKSPTSRKKSERYICSCCQESHKNIHLKATTYQQSGAGSWHSASVSLHPYEYCLVDLMCHVLLVSSIPTDSYRLPSPLLRCVDLQGEEPNKHLQFILFLHTTSDFECLRLLTTAAGGGLSDDGCTRHQSMRIEEYHLLFYMQSHFEFPGWTAKPFILQANLASNLE